MRSDIGGKDENLDREYSEILHYLLNYETGQVKRWIDEDAAPLVSQAGVRFGPDFISWDYDGDPVDPHLVERNTLRPDRETLAIDGGFQMKHLSPGVGGCFQIVTVTGQCEKTEIPWGKLKPKKI